MAVDARAGVSPEPAPPAALRRMRALWPELSPRLRAAAAWLLGHPQEAATYPLQAVAEASGSSPATVVRLCQRAGYRGFRQFQLALGYELASPGAPEPIADLDQAATLREAAAAAVEASRRMLAETASRLDWAALEEMAQAMAGARRLGILAQGASVTVGVDLQYHLSKLALPVTLLVDPYLQAIYAAGSGPGDVLLAISYAGHNRDLLEAVQLAAGAGAQTLALTARRGSPLARAARVALTVADTETVFRGEPLTARLAFLLASDLLLVAIARALPDSAKAWQQVHRALEGKRGNGGRAHRLDKPASR